MPTLELDSRQRRALRAAAHLLRPVVLIGDRGLTEPVLAEVDHNLAAHELIKIHVAGADRPSRDDILHTLCERLSCAAISHIGKTLIVYRPGPKTQQAEAEKNRTRALRKKSDPYVPKKRAAQNHEKVTPKSKAGNTPLGERGSESARPHASGQARPHDSRRAMADHVAGAGRRGRDPGQRPSAARRTSTRVARPRSALSLRAGARRRHVSSK